MSSLLARARERVSNASSSTAPTATWRPVVHSSARFVVSSNAATSTFLILRDDAGATPSFRHSTGVLLHHTNPLARLLARLLASPTAAPLWATSPPAPSRQRTSNGTMTRASAPRRTGSPCPSGRGRRTRRRRRDGTRPTFPRRARPPASTRTSRSRARSSRPSTRGGTLGRRQTTARRR